MAAPNSPSAQSEADNRLARKIANLPKPTRDMINLMIEDGLPYHTIIDELAEASRGLTPQSFTKWLQSGNEDYLKSREKIEDAKTQAEFVADLLRGLGGAFSTVLLTIISQPTNTWQRNSKALPRVSLVEEFKKKEFALELRA